MRPNCKSTIIVAAILSIIAAVTVACILLLSSTPGGNINSQINNGRANGTTINSQVTNGTVISIDETNGSIIISDDTTNSDTNSHDTTDSVTISDSIDNPLEKSSTKTAVIKSGTNNVAIQKPNSDTNSHDTSDLVTNSDRTDNPPGKSSTKTTAINGGTQKSHSGTHKGAKVNPPNPNTPHKSSKLDELPTTLKWATIVHKKYYNRPYSKSHWHKLTKTINGKSLTVWRPNHSTAHAIRQGLEVKDIITVLNTIDLSRLTTKGQNLAKYIRHKLQSDPNFSTKLEIIGLYYRSGREGEMSPSTDFAKYKQSGYNSANYFLKDSNSIDPKLFSNVNEIQMFYYSMISEYIDKSLRNDKTNEINYIYQLSHAAHFIDLVRLKQVSLTKWKQNGDFFHSEVSNIIGFKSDKDKCVDELVKRGYEYVKSTGDLRYKNGGYSDLYYRLHNNVVNMVEVLYGVYKKDFKC